MPCVEPLVHPDQEHGRSVVSSDVDIEAIHQTHGERASCDGILGSASNTYDVQKLEQCLRPSAHSHKGGLAGAMWYCERRDAVVDSVEPHGGHHGVG